MTNADVISAILAWPTVYESESGRKFIGCPISALPATLRDSGWRRISRKYSDRADLRDMGFEVILGRYAQSARKPGRYVTTIVAKWKG